MEQIQAQIDSVFKHCMLPRAAREFQHQRMFATPDISPVGRVIKDALARLGRNQSWLCEVCGVSNQAVTNWIQTGKISREYAIAAAKALQIPVGALISDEDPMAARIGAIIAALPDGPQQQAFDFVSFLWQRPDAGYSSEKAAQYAEMIERIKADMAARSRPDDAE
jgi:hypothetical protein